MSFIRNHNGAQQHREIIDLVSEPEPQAPDPDNDRVVDLVDLVGEPPVPVANTESDYHYSDEDAMWHSSGMLGSSDSSALMEAAIKSRMEYLEPHPRDENDPFKRKLMPSEEFNKRPRLENDREGFNTPPFSHAASTHLGTPQRLPTPEQRPDSVKSERESSGTPFELVPAQTPRLGSTEGLKAEPIDIYEVDPRQMSRKDRNRRFKQSLDFMSDAERGAAISFRGELDGFSISLGDRAKELEFKAELETSSLGRGFFRDMADKYSVLAEEVRECFYDLQLHRYSEASVLDFIENTRAGFRDRNRRLQRLMQNYHASLNVRAVQEPGYPRPGPSETRLVRTGDLNDDARQEIEKEYERLLDKIHNNIMPMAMPPELDVSDLEHQRLGLGWLVGVEKGPNHGGILADDMGLGKTIQSIALIYAHPPEETGPQLTLIVCSTALIQTWLSELHDRVHPEFRKRVYIHHRATNRDMIMDPKQIERLYDVVITTYTTLLYETDAQAKRNRRPLPSIQWWRIILDEAHTIKNHAARTSIACASLTAVNRICLSGTPMQNNLFELWPLVRFLRINPYWDSMSKFKDILPKDKVTMANSTWKDIGEEPGSSRHNQKFKTLLRMILLRRRKTTMINGRKILEGLPSKTTCSVKVAADATEAVLYTEKEAGFAGKVKRELETTSMSGILAALLRMRQQACHPLLIPFTSIILGKTDISVSDDEIKSATDVLAGDRDLPTLLEKLEGAQCSNCFNTAPMEEGGLIVITSCMHCICRPCLEQIRDEYEASGEPLRCPSCNGLMSQRTPLRVLEAVIEKVSEEAEDIQRELKFKFQQSQKHTKHAMLAWQHKINEMIETLEDEVDLIMERGIDPKMLAKGFEVTNRGLLEEVSATPVVDDPEEDSSLNHFKSIEALKNEECGREIKYALDIDQIARSFPVPGVFEKGWISSAKIDSCMALLAEIWEHNPTDKVIIFSSFTSFLELFKIPFTAARIPYTMYTGAMDVEERNTSLEKFKNGIEKVLLISLKAGNVGLTLTSANRVILAEPFWNPFVEEQAKDRVHRIGQSKEVHIYRLFNKGTVEDRIYEVQEKKRKIIGEALDSKAGGGAKVTRQDLLYMLGIGQPSRT